MIYSKEKPAIYDRLHDKFGVEWDSGICITYGDKYHCKYPLSDDFIAHEEVHMHQQRTFGPEIWWKTYINDPVFRLSQEVEAYRAQIKYLKDYPELHSREVRRFAYKKLAEYLSSSVYGNIVSYKKALELLK